MYKMLCLKGCIHCKKEATTTQQQDYHYIPTPHIRLRRYTCKFISCEKCFEKNDCEIFQRIELNVITHCTLYCNYKQRHVIKYLTECDFFSNTTLFDRPKKPEWLETLPYTNDCPYCNGKGYGIVRDYEKHYNLDGSIKQFTAYSKETCINCNGKGIIRRIKFAESNKENTE